MQKLSELIETYPSSYTKGIQTLITAKKELAELSSSSSEKAPEFGSFFKHQLLTHRVLRFLDDFLVISETGTGKSAEILGFTESALNAYDNERSGIEYDDRLSHFGRIMIFAGELQEEDIKNQLINKIARKYLEVKDISDAKNEKMRRAGVKRVLKRAGYQIHQYRSFCNSIRRDYPETAEGDRRMAEDFSDTIFWIDEVHNITGSEDQNSDKGDDNVSDDATIYETFWRIFHTAKRCKKIISTATPMINSEEELKSILNLILPKNGEIPIELDYTNLDKIEMKTWFPEIPENTDMTQISREDAQIYFRGQIPKDFRVSSTKINEIEPYLRGRIGYIRALDTGATPVYHGECLHIPMIDSITGKHYESKVVTVNSFMSEHQAAGYIKMSAKNDFYQSSRQASNIVFPDGETSSTEYDKAKGFKAYVTKRNNKYYMNSELRRHFSTIEGIRNLSCKYATIVENILKNHGNTFVYVNFLELGSVSLGLCLEGMGFARFNESESIFLSDIVPRNIKYNFIPKSFGGPWRYALLQGDTSNNERASILETMNSYENRNGDLIKVLITSKTGRDGINVNNVLHIHLVGSEWNQSAMYQALSRGIRATSHSDLLNDERKRLIDSGQDPALAKIDINVYLHAAIANFENEIISTDLKMYTVAEMKDMRIRKAMRFLKKCSVGCQINYHRNVRDSDVDYSAQCDFEKCKYRCFDQNPKKIDYSTYDIIYSENIINNIKSDISRLFVRRAYLSLDNIVTELSKYRDLQIIKTIEKIITNKIPILDKYGYISYLKEDGDMYYLDKSYSNTENHKGVMNSYYSTNLIALDYKNISEISENINKKELTYNTDILLKLFKEKDYTGFDKILNNFDAEFQALILEDALFKYYSEGEFTENYLAYIYTIITKYKRMIFHFNEPVKEIENLRKEQLLGKKKRGKKAKTEKIKIKNFKDNELDEIVNMDNYNDENGDPLIIHILYSQAVDRTKYAATSRFNKAEGRIRVFDILIGEWKDVTQFELPIYNKLIQIENRKRIKPLEDIGLYGIVNIDGTFRIRNKLLEKEGAENNGRKIKRGKECHTWERDELIDIMWEIGAPLQNIDKRELTATERENAIIFLSLKDIKKPKEELISWSSEKLFFYTIWYYSRDKTREDICKIIKTEMINKDLII